VDIVQHELPDYFHLLASLAVEAGHRPLRIPRMWRHLCDNTRLFRSPRILGIMNGRIVPNLLGENRVETYTQMKIK
jgi:hypothetical protein